VTRYWNHLSHRPPTREEKEKKKEEVKGKIRLPITALKEGKEAEVFLLEEGEETTGAFSETKKGASPEKEGKGGRERNRLPKSSFVKKPTEEKRRGGEALGLLSFRGGGKRKGKPPPRTTQRRGG